MLREFYVQLHSPMISKLSKHQSSPHAGILERSNSTDCLELVRPRERMRKDDATACSRNTCHHMPIEGWKTILDSWTTLLSSLIFRATSNTRGFSNHEVLLHTVQGMTAFRVSTSWQSASNASLRPLLQSFTKERMLNNQTIYVAQCVNIVYTHVIFYNILRMRAIYR